MRLRRPWLAAGAVGLLAGGCAGPCEDDGFGQDDPSKCSAVASGSADDGSTSRSDDTTPADADGAVGSSTDDSSTGGSETGEGTTGSGDTANDDSTGSQTTRWCPDRDGDRFGADDGCVEVAAGETPPEDFVQDNTDCNDNSAETHPGAAELEDPPLCHKDEDDDGFGDVTPGNGVEPGSDCVDTNAFIFPGAAELDDAAACMKDADEDGYGDAAPPAAAEPGTDCDDDDPNVPSGSGCFVWCLDSDSDTFGDPDTCVDTDMPPPGYVANADDCDDSNEFAFPGAAPLDDAMACLEDEDGDDFGDAMPPAGVDAGTDCDDLDAMVQSGCITCTPDALECDPSDDVVQCNSTGTFLFPVEDCQFGCNDAAPACWPELTADAQAGGSQCANSFVGAPVNLSANAMGGDGNYAFSWLPTGSLDDSTIANPIATPTETTTYNVTVLDTESNMASDSVTVHMSTQPIVLSGCPQFTFPDPFENPSVPDPNLVFLSGGTEVCNFAGSVPVVTVCDQVHAQARLSFEAGVSAFGDDDAFGFVWGWQDAAHFYLLSWKQATQATPFGDWEAGITIKRIEAPTPADVTGADLVAVSDTPNSTLLAGPTDFLDQGWKTSRPTHSRSTTTLPTPRSRSAAAPTTPSSPSARSTTPPTPRAKPAPSTPTNSSPAPAPGPPAACRARPSSKHRTVRIQES